MTASAPPDPHPDSPPQGPDQTPDQATPPEPGRENVEDVPEEATNNIEAAPTSIAGRRSFQQE